jgi:hypothetical protein
LSSMAGLFEFSVNLCPTRYQFRSGTGMPASDFFRMVGRR